MLGWHISAYRFADQDLRQARCDLNSLTKLLAAQPGSPDVGNPEDNLRLAVWQTPLDGVDWLEALAAADEAAATSRNGYPNTYVIRFRHLQTQLTQGLLNPRRPWRSEPGDSFLPAYLGHDTAFEKVLEATDPREWIVVRAWDES